VQAFFDALKDESSADSVWFRGVNNNMTRMIALRKAANCESFDHSAEEIYMEHIKALLCSMAADSNQAAGKLPVATTSSLLDTVVVTRRRCRVTSFAFPSGGALTGASANSTYNAAKSHRSRRPTSAPSSSPRLTEPAPACRSRHRR
jgi:hypothetical protein